MCINSLESKSSAATSILSPSDPTKEQNMYRVWKVKFAVVGIFLQTYFHPWKFLLIKKLKIEKVRTLSVKTNVSQEILSWHSLRHSHSADICIHFYCLSWLRQARQRKMIQKSALWLCLRLCQFKIFADTWAFSNYFLNIFWICSGGPHILLFWDLKKSCYAKFVLVE